MISFFQFQFSRFLLTALLAALSTLALPTGLWATRVAPAQVQMEPEQIGLEEVGRAVLVRNDVRGRPPGVEAVALAEGAILVLDELIETGDDSAFKMQFEPGGALSLGSRTRVLLDRGTVERSGKPGPPRFKIDFGSLLLKLNPRSRSERKIAREIEVETPTAVIGVKGTTFRLFVYESGLTLVTVIEGILRVDAKESGKTVEVKAGERTVVESFGPPSRPAPAPANDAERIGPRREAKRAIKPRLTACPKTVVAGRLACVCGSFADDAVAAALSLDGRPLGEPVSVSPVAAMVRIPADTTPGEHLLTGERGIGFKKKDRCRVDVFTVESSLDREAIRRRGSTQLRLRVEGTREPVQVRLRNRSPRKIRLEGGVEQTAKTSGGKKNTLERRVKSLGPEGEFNIDYTILGTACPCAGDLADPSSDPEVLR